MADHVHHPECKHNHRHKPDCAHGTPTAVPAPGTCKTCLRYTIAWAYCGIHYRWECPRHPGKGRHHGGEPEA